MPNDPNAATASEQPNSQTTSVLTPSLTVIGVGASAGGLAALRAFFSALPEQSGLTFVVIVHLSPEHESQLAALLQPYTDMPVMQVTERVQMQPEHVYVIPPAKQMVVTDNGLDLVEIEGKRHRPTQIDAFFRSLAENHGDGGAVILSGSGSDGAVGIQAIKEKGGLLLVQSPAEAEYDGMPRSAIATGLVDIVAPVAELAKQLVAAKHLNINLQLPADGENLTESAQQALTQILTQLRVRTGHDFSGYKSATLLRRLARRMQVTQVTTLTSYLHRLRNESAEAELLLRDLLINVTEFFRDREAWAVLETSILPKLFAGKGRDDSVRVWTVGCATGEEAYSIAMLLLEYASGLVAPPSIQVFASDLGQAALDFAREGCYPGAIADDLSEARLARFFTPENSHYQVRPELREVILFTQHNLLQDPPFSRLDLILCRNLLIYIQRELQEKIFQTFYYALRPNRYLFLGNAESAEGSTDLFETLDKRQRIYQRRTRNNAFPILPSLPLLPQAVRIPAAGSESARTAQPQPREEHQWLLDVVAPPSLLVDRESNVLHLSETVGRYLLPPGGAPTVELLKLVRPELQIELRTALFRAFEDGKAVTTQPVPVRFNGAPHFVYVMVRSHQLANGSQRALVIFLEDETPVTRESATPSHGDFKDVARQQLEAELSHVQGRLQSMHEEYETTVEELRAANEELQSTNEEYKSTLEELETSKEELQSINEELETINQELKSKVEEVTYAHSDVQNLFVATEIATLFLDRELRVKRYTPHAGELFNLMPPDNGRPIGHLRGNLIYEDLEADAKRVLTHLTPIEREARSQDESWFLVRMRPYRTLEDKIDGVVITFTDITVSKTNEQALRRSKEYVESILHTIPNPLLVLTPDLRVQMANDAFYEAFQVNQTETEGRLIYELGNGQWQIPKLHALLDEILPHNNIFTGYEVDHVFQRIGRRTMLLNGCRLDHASLILLSITDISQRKQAEEQLLHSAELNAFRLHLTDVLRQLATTTAIKRVASRVLGEQLQVDCVYFAEVNPTNEEFVIQPDYYSRAKTANIAGSYRIQDYSPFVLSELLANRAVVVVDTQTLAELSEAERAEYAASDVAALMVYPIFKVGSLAALLGVTHSTPRQWSEDDLALLRESAERSWAALELAQAATAMHKSEENYRALFDSIDEGFCIIEVLFENDKAVDYRFLEVNPAFEKQTGLVNALGKTIREFAPEHEEYWFEIYGKIAMTGESARFESPAYALGRFYDVYAFRAGAPEERQVAVLFNDITERKRREANLAFLAEVSADFAPPASADALMASICEKLSSYLMLSRCDFSVVDVEADRITTIYDGRRDADAPSVLGEHAISTFLSEEAKQAYVAGTMAVVNDTHHDPKINAPPEMMDALRIRSLVDAPFLENGEWKFLLSACRSEVSVWRADEVELLRELTSRLYIRLERAHAEDALGESKERLQQALSIDTVGVLFFRLDGRITDVNKAFEQWVGYTRDELCANLSLETLTAPEYREVTRRAMEDLATLGATAPYEKELVRKDGSRWWGLCASKRLSGSGRAAECVKFAIDISERKTAEAALQRLNATLEQEVDRRTAQVRELASTLTLAEQRERRRLSQFLHDDLQQLLYGVQMRLVSIMEDINPLVPALVMRYAGETDSWLTQAIQMVRQLTVDLSPPVLKGEGLTDALRWLVRQMLEVNGLHVELQAAHAFRLPSEDMRVLIFQIVRELLFNVVKHSGTDRAKVELLDGLPGILRIVISDEGRGFDPTKLAAKQEGGFGLFSIRERLDLFSGRMEIQSAPGQGTRITLTVRVGEIS